MIAFQPRDEPLPAAGVAAQGPAARRLAARLLELPDDGLARLTGVAAPFLLVALGDEASLPWVDGAVYLGRDPGAASLYLPTALDPGASPALLERALLRRYPELRPPLALLPSGHLASLASARAVDRTALLALTWR